MKHFLQLSLLIYLVFAYEDKYLTQLVYKFIYNNEKICGDPFWEANWLPAMGDCIIDCEPTQYICLVSTVKDGVQKCRELTHNCTMSVRKSLGWTTTFYKTTTLAPRTTLSQVKPKLKPFFKTKISKQVNNHTIPASQQKLNLKPHHNTKFQDPPRYTIRSLESISGNDNNLQSPSPIDKEYDDTKPAFVVAELSPPPKNSDYEGNRLSSSQFHAVNSLNHIPTNSKSSKDSSYHPFFDDKASGFLPSDRFVSSQSLFDSMEREQQAAAKIAHGKNKAFVVEESFEVVDGLNNTPQMPSFRPPSQDDLPIAGTRVEIVPPLPPPDSFFATPVSLPVSSNSVAKKGNKTDSSPNCCEWALNGLCDRSWRKIREMCPQSCGTLSCEQLEGIMSCTRIINVDVEECYQTVRLHRYFGLKNVRVDEKKKLIVDLLKENMAAKTKKRSRKTRKRKIKMKIRKI